MQVGLMGLGIDDGNSFSKHIDHGKYMPGLIFAWHSIFSGEDGACLGLEPIAA
jgi:hypothetical protein